MAIVKAYHSPYNNNPYSTNMFDTIKNQSNVFSGATTVPSNATASGTYTYVPQNNSSATQTSPYLSGGSSGTSGYGSSSAESELDFGAYFAAMLEQQRRLREMQTQAANASIDSNANYAIDQLAKDKENQSRQAYISKEKSLNSLPQASLAMGGGGLSESSLLGVNSGYENQIGELTEMFNTNKGDILNQANNAKAQNLANETASALDFANQMPSYLAQMASMPGVTSDSMQGMISAMSSAMPSNSYTSLKARGLTDEELRQMGLL